MTKPSMKLSLLLHETETYSRLTRKLKVAKNPCKLHTNLYLNSAIMATNFGGKLFPPNRLTPFSLLTCLATCEERQQHPKVNHFPFQVGYAHQFIKPNAPLTAPTLINRFL
jgi:hypothetical protein